MSTNFIGVLLANSPTYTVTTGFNTQLYDAAGAQSITVQAGASLSLVGSLGANSIRLSGTASSWQAYRDGSTAILLNTDGSRIEIPATTDIQTLQFDDLSRELRIDVSGAAAAVLLGSQTLGSSAVAIGDPPPSPDPEPDPTPDPGSGSKTPWTLVMGVNNYYISPNLSGVFISDGTAEGTGVKAMDGIGYNTQFVTTPDQTKAFFYQIGSSWGGSYDSGQLLGVVGVSDGSFSGTVVLAQRDLATSPATYLPGNFITVTEDGHLLAAGTESSQGSTGAVLTSDGTVAGTAVSPLDFVVPMNSGISDPAHHTLWFWATTAPYGTELVRFSYAPGSTPVTTLVKDIYPGSSSSAYNATDMALLPNGNLVFAAYDGVHGREPWVSDGSEAGTVLLGDLYDGTGSSYPQSFTRFGDKIAFLANTTDGYTLFFTDGTSTGTTSLDVNPGYYNYAYPSSTTILGQVGNLLYYTASTGSYETPSRGIFSTDGTSITRLADINSSATLLGWSAETAFFSVSDAEHGSELWAADLKEGGFGLVKDILPGSGSALAGTANAFMVGDKLVFNAYTSATALGLFLSDGTADGTVQLGGKATYTKALGSTLIFSDANGLYGVDSSAATPAVETLVVTTSYASSYLYNQLQTDADQLFFRTSSGDLYASNGTTAGTVKLAGSVTEFKVVADDALFFFQGDKALWYSDGTAAGTRFIEDQPAGFYMSGMLQNAVAIHTVGVAPDLPM